MKVLLKGVVGSTAYGLNHEGSYVDYLGVFAAPNREILGLGKVQESVNTKDPDTTMHEAKKFVQLCLNGNPSVSEVLWLDQVRSPLPERPDAAMVENWLLWVRRRNWSWA